MTVRRLPFVLAVAACLGWADASASRAAAPPAWLRDAAAAPLAPGLDRDADAVVLLDDAAVDLGSDGRQRTVTRYAVRIRTVDGRAAASLSDEYVAGSGRLRDVKAWLITPSGQVVEFGRGDVLDRAVGLGDDVYSEQRVQTVSAGARAEPGSIFGAEISTDELTVITHFVWPLQDRWPVALSRRSLKTPDKWATASATFNHAPIAPMVTGRVTQWEVRDLPGIRKEPAMPPLSALAPRLVASALPPPDVKVPLLDSWAAVSGWLASLQDPAVAGSGPIRDKALALSGAEPTALGKIQAVGRYVQGVRYVSIQMGLAHGGGYQPRPAADLLTKNYGDCKDKANLMRSLLSALGFRTYMVGAFLGDPGFVREEWPSPTQFNHAIVAVSVDAATKAPAVIEHPRLGSLLIIDVTDEETPVGELSVDLQGSLGLMVSPTEGTLVRLPVTPPDRNLVERRWTGQLDVSGTLTGSLVETRHGEEAANFRRALRDLSGTAFADSIERRISASLKGARVDRFEPKSTPDRFDLTLAFTAPRYAQLIQPTLLLVQPPDIDEGGLDLSSPTRQSPIRLSADVLKEWIDLLLPEGFGVDELPSPVTLETTFGRFIATARVEGHRVLLERSMVLPGGLVPAARAADVRQFFERVRAARSSPVVVKKPGA
jgi:hypothetical protein